MITSWIAKSLQEGRDHLILDTSELVQWQAQGCKVSLDAPYGLHGSYIKRQLWHFHAELRDQLAALPPVDWPVGSFQLRAMGNQCTVEVPQRQFEPAGPDQWRVPLIPDDVNHYLEGWSFDVQLTEEEWSAIQPLAYRLIRRCLIRCEIAASHLIQPNQPLWNPGRIRLATLAGIQNDELLAWFGLGQGWLLTAESLDTEHCIDAWRNQRQMNAEDQYRREVLNDRRVICNDERYIHEIKINGYGLHREEFRLAVYSTLKASWQMCEGLKKLELKLTRDEMVLLKDVLEEHLGLRQVPLPYYPDICLEVGKMHDREAQWLASEANDAT